MLVLALLAASTPFQIAVDGAEFPNVVYHLACLAERVPCTRAPIERFWREDLRWNETDQRWLDAWKTALRNNGARQPKPDPVPFLPNFAAFYPELSAVQGVMSAALDSRSPSEFRKRTESSQLVEALEHFQRRFRPWWKTHGRRYADEHRRALQDRVKSRGFAELTGQVARFMESDIADRAVRVHLIARADRGSDTATATFVRNHVFLEVTSRTKVDDATPIVMHELTHALYELAPMRRHRQLILEFAASPEPAAQALYALLNEGIATAVQLLMLRAAGQSEYDAYRHPFIPRIGRAAAVPLRNALREQGTLFDSYVAPYIGAAAAEMKEELGSPRFLLSSRCVGLIGYLPKAARALHSEFPAVSGCDIADRQNYTDVNLVMLVTYDKLGALADNWPEIVPLSRKHRAFAFSAPRNKKGRVFVLAGGDDDAVESAVQRLAAVRTGALDGLILSVD